MLPTILDLSSLRAAYQSGLTPLDLAEEVIARRAASNDPAIFITPTPDDDLRQAARDLVARAPAANSLPLWGIPFAVKDNIDAAGLPTTAACPAYSAASFGINVLASAKKPRALKNFNCEAKPSLVAAGLELMKSMSAKLRLY